MPSAAFYVVEFTFPRGFDSFRAHHVSLPPQDLLVCDGMYHCAPDACERPHKIDRCSAVRATKEDHVSHFSVVGRNRNSFYGRVELREADDRCCNRGAPFYSCSLALWS